MSSILDIGISLFLTYFFITELLLGCSHAKPEPQPADPPAAVVERQELMANRLAGFAPDGFVITLANGEPIAQGDSLIFTGIAGSSLTCAQGEKIDQALQAMVRDTGGDLYRHPTLKNHISDDGALGFYRHVAYRVTRCAGGAAWAPVLALHKGIVPFLNRQAGVQLDEPFTYVRDKLFARLGLGPEPGADRKTALEAEMAAWALATRDGRTEIQDPEHPGTLKIAREACYRVNLALLALETVESLGSPISGPGRDAFCGATAGLDLPTTDHWCGRGDLRAWADGFKLNEWQYRHQRCPGWETPDGGGFDQPAVDYLRAVASAYRLVVQ